MNKLMLTLIVALCFSARADIVVSNLTEVVKTEKKTVVVSETTTNKLAFASAKAVWVQFATTYAPPKYEVPTYSVTSFLQDIKTKMEIPKTRATDILTMEQVTELAKENGIPFDQVAGAIGVLINKHLEKKYQTK